MIIVYITLVFLFAFYIQSIYGIAGPVVAFLILGFFIDVKEIVFLSLFFSFFASIFVLFSDIKSFSLKEYLYMLKYTLLPILVGAYLLDYLDSKLILKTFAIFMIIFSLYSFLNPVINKIIQKNLLIISGTLTGMLGAGGPLTAALMKNEFKTKSNFRTTFAVYFITMNIIRYIQYLIQGTFEYSQISPYMWSIVPLLFVIWLGHKTHKIIPEETFKKGVSMLLLISGIVFLFK